MKQVIITRTDYSDMGTFGLLTTDDNTGWTCSTGELPDKNNDGIAGNEKGMSCIPCGTYTCTWGWSNHLKRECYHVNDVEGRSGILIHPANFCGDKSKGYDADIQGCIALGLKVSLITNSKGQMQKAIVNSRSTVAIFERMMNKEPFELTIKELI